MRRTVEVRDEDSGVGEAGNLDARIEDAVRQHATLVFRIAHSVLRNVSDAEDAAQEVFLRVLRYREKVPEVREVVSLEK